MFDRIVAAIGRGDLGAGARGSREPARHAARVARGVGGVRGPRDAAPDVAATCRDVPLTSLVPGDLETRTGGYGYDRRIVAGLRERGWPVDVRVARRQLPVPDAAAAREHAVATLAAIPDGATVLVDGLALGALPTRSSAKRERLSLVALVHHPLARGDRPRAGERGFARGRASGARWPPSRSWSSPVASTAERSARYGVGREQHRGRRAGDRPGAACARLAEQPGDAGDLALLCVATLTPRKGHEIAVSRARGDSAPAAGALTCAGSARPRSSAWSSR